MENSKQQNSNPAFQDQVSRTPYPDKIEDGIVKRLAVTVMASPDTAYNFWRDFKNFPLFMKNILSVEVRSPTTSHWVMKMKGAPDLEWDAAIIKDEPNKLISWQSTGDSMLKQAGSVWFKAAPNNKGTIVNVNISYDIPGGKAGELASKLLGDDPETMILTDLRRFKAYIETGEVPTIEGQPNGKDKPDVNTQTH